jgi:hypothetical protein
MDDSESVSGTDDPVSAWRSAIPPIGATKATRDGRISHISKLEIPTVRSFATQQPRPRVTLVEAPEDQSEPSLVIPGKLSLFNAIA